MAVILIILTLLFSHRLDKELDGEFDQCTVQNVWLNREIKDGIIGALSEAGESILLVNYKFDNREIAESLVDAGRRGVDIDVVLDDKSESMLMGNGISVPEYLAASGIDVWIYDDDPNILHMKLILIDGERLLLGSQNFCDEDLENNYESFLEAGIQQRTKQLIYDEIASLKDESVKASYSMEGLPSGDLGDEPGHSGNGPMSADSALSQSAGIKLFGFSPENNASEAVKSVIGSAEKEMYISEAFIRDYDLARLIADRRRDGIECHLLTNNSNHELNYYLYKNGIEIKECHADGILMHNKYIIIDGQYAFYGSLNLFDRSMTADREIYMYVDCRELCGELIGEFKNEWDDPNFSVPTEVTAKGFIKIGVGLAGSVFVEYKIQIIVFLSYIVICITEYAVYKAIVGNSLCDSKKKTAMYRILKIGMDFHSTN